MRFQNTTALTLAATLMAAPLASTALAQQMGDGNTPPSAPGEMSASVMGAAVYGSDGYIIGSVLGAEETATGRLESLTVAVNTGGTAEIGADQFTLNKGTGQVHLDLTEVEVDRMAAAEAGTTTEQLGALPKKTVEPTNPGVNPGVPDPDGMATE